MATPTLSPSQRKTYAQALKDVSDTSLVVVWGESGLGRTTIMKALRAATGGAFLSMRDYVERMAAAHPLAFEETFQEFVLSAFKRDIVPRVGAEQSDPVAVDLNWTARLKR